MTFIVSRETRLRVDGVLGEVHEEPVYERGVLVAGIDRYVPPEKAVGWLWTVTAGWQPVASVNDERWGR